MTQDPYESGYIGAMIEITATRRTGMGLPCEQIEPARVARVLAV